MNLTTADDFTASRAFGNESGYELANNTLSCVALRVIGAFGGGLALTALLAALIHV